MVPPQCVLRGRFLGFCQNKNMDLFKLFRTDSPILGIYMSTKAAYKRYHQQPGHTKQSCFRISLQTLSSQCLAKPRGPPACRSEHSKRAGRLVSNRQAWSGCVSFSPYKITKEAIGCLSHERSIKG